MLVWAFHGMRRSGNHAVLNWTSLPRSTFFLNDILQSEQVSVVLGDPFTPKGLWAWFLRLAMRKRMRKPLLKTGRRLASGGLCVSLEDWPINAPIFDPWPRRCRHVLLLRDPMNMFASRIRMMGGGMHRFYAQDRADLYFQNSIELWKMHAREFLGETNHLPGHVGVYYDRWVADPAYRVEVAAKLGLVPDERALSHVAPEGGGSSFEGMAPLGDDAIARRLSRHSQLEGDEKRLFARVTDDSDLMQLRERVLDHVFGDTKRLMVA
jgi:hypothetical protein